MNAASVLVYVGSGRGSGDIGVPITCAISMLCLEPGLDSTYS